MNTLIPIAIVTLFILNACASKTHDRTQSAENRTMTSPPDEYRRKDENVHREARERADYHNRKTADTQAMSAERDTDITRTIRQRLMDDDSLSVNAHNIKIITLNNRVTLKGVVDTASERKKVESIAKGVVGKAEVINNTVISK